MCKSKKRSVYLKEESGNIQHCFLVYDRLDEKDIGEYYNAEGLCSEEFPLWMLEHLSGTVHTPTVREVTHKFYTASVLGDRARWKKNAKNGTPRYITVLTVVNSKNEAIAGGCSVCSALDIPDRSIGYRVAFDRMKKTLKSFGLTIVPRTEVEKC